MQIIKFSRVSSQWVKTVLAGAAVSALAACGGGGDDASWIGTWSAAPTGPSSLTASAPFVPSMTYENQTIRMIVRSSAAGKAVRLRLSNEIGDAPAAVHVGAAHIALRDKGSAILAGTDRTLTFGGKKDVTIPPKGVVYSDPVELGVGPLADMVLSVYLPEKSVVQSNHFVTRQINYVAPGDVTGSANLDGISKPLPFWVLATGVDVLANAPTALVAFGDSITDGFGDALVRTDAPTPWPSWPSRLAERLSGNASLAGLAVLNAGISGNRILSDAPNLGPTAAGVRALAFYGPKGVDRFQRDVVAQSGASCVVILQGINDIGIGSVEGKPPTLDQLIAGHKTLIAKAKAGGLRAIGATLTPFGGYSATPGYYSADNDAKRQALNTWIRTSGSYDAVVDFEAAVRDPSQPTRMLAQYDSGDHLHPNDAGYKVMAESIDLSVLQKLCLK